MRVARERPDRQADRATTRPRPALPGERVGLALDEHAQSRLGAVRKQGRQGQHSAHGALLAESDGGPLKAVHRPGFLWCGPDERRLAFALRSAKPAMYTISRSAISPRSPPSSILLTGCAAFGGGGRTRAEPATSPATLTPLQCRLGRMRARNYLQAALIFDEVERQQPYSVWARREQLMSAFNYYAARDHTKSIESARRSCRSNRASRRALCALPDRVKLLRADQRRHPRPGDHPHALGDAGRARPPLSDTPYAKMPAEDRLVRDHLAGKEMEVGRFYQRRRPWSRRGGCASAPWSTITRPQPRRRSLVRLTESYLALGIPDQARRSASVLGANYRRGHWYRRAYELVQRHAPDGAATAPAAGRAEN